jgi:hypothetical protein
LFRCKDTTISFYNIILKNVLFHLLTWYDYLCAINYSRNVT